MNSAESRPPVPVIDHGTGWMVVDKPSGMSVHNDPGGDLCTVLAQWLRSDRTFQQAVSFDPAYGLHPVHRLDKETSGIILLAGRRDIFQHFARQFSRGRVSKRYLALVHGAVSPASCEGLWHWSLTSRAAGRRNPRGQGRRSPSQTRYRVLHRTPHYTLIACFPLTGRTHQIRRHAALAGHPLVGDQRYGSLRACRYVAERYNFSRLALHAHGLALACPHEPEDRRFESSGLPEEIGRLIDADATGSPS